MDTLYVLKSEEIDLSDYINNKVRIGRKIDPLRKELRSPFVEVNEISQLGVKEGNGGDNVEPSPPPHE